MHYGSDISRKMPEGVEPNFLVVDESAGFKNFPMPKGVQPNGFRFAAIEGNASCLGDVPSARTTRSCDRFIIVGVSDLSR